MRHVDMRKLPAAAQEERRRQVIGLRQAGMTYAAIAEQVGLSRTGVFDICRRFVAEGAKSRARWGARPQKPIRRAYERDPAAVRRWLRRAGLPGDREARQAGPR